jgi:GTP cyclohydrolase I
MTHQIAEALVELTQPHGVAVYMEAHHLCTQMRGVREDRPMTRTTSFRGVFETSAALRS